MFSYEKPSKKKFQFLPRLATLLLSAGLIYVLYTHSPDADKLKLNAKKAHDQIFDYLDVYGKGKQFLPGNVTAGHAGQGNGTGNGSTSANASSASSGQGSSGSAKKGASREPLQQQEQQRTAPHDPTEPDDDL